MQCNGTIARHTLTFSKQRAVNDQQLRTTTGGKIQTPVDAVSVDGVPDMSCNRPASGSWKVKILKGVQKANLILLVKPVIEPDLPVKLLALDQING